MAELGITKVKELLQYPFSYRLRLDSRVVNVEFSTKSIVKGKRGRSSKETFLSKTRTFENKEPQQR